MYSGTIQRNLEANLLLYASVAVSSAAGVPVGYRMTAYLDTDRLTCALLWLVFICGLRVPDP